MARGGVDPIVRYAVLGGLGFIAYKYAEAQPASSWPKQTADQVAGWLRKPSLPGGITPPRTGSNAPVGTPSNPRTGLPPGTWTDPGGNPVPAPPPIPSNQATIALNLVDLGGFPVVLDPNTSAIEQDPALGGTNVYGPGDVVQDAGGVQYLIEAGRGGPFLGAPDGATRAVDEFRA